MTQTWPVLKKALYDQDLTACGETDPSGGFSGVIGFHVVNLQKMGGL
jgi:hypothetical protein